MDDSRIEDLYRILIEGNYIYIDGFENTPYSPEIAVIQLMSKQIKKGKQVNILPELDKIIGIEPEYEYLFYEAHFLANNFHNRQDKENRKRIAEKAVSVGSVPVYSLMYLGIVYEKEKKINEAVLCFTKITQKFPNAINARTNWGYLLATKYKKYAEAKKLILEGGRNWISWSNHKGILIRQYNLGIPLIAGFTLLFWLINSSWLDLLLLLFALGLFFWSNRFRQRFIMDSAYWLIFISIFVSLLLRITITPTRIATGFSSIGYGKNPVSTHVVSPIDRINLEDLMITTNDLPSAISWDTSGIHHVVDEYFGVNGENAVSAMFFPLSTVNKSSTVSTLSISRLESNSIAEENYNKPSRTDLYGYAPPEWKFRSKFADENRITCDGDYGHNFNAPMSCIWVARYGEIIVSYDAWVDTDEFTLENMQTTVEKIDAKITRVLRNIQ